MIHTPFAFQPGDDQDPRDASGEVIYDPGVTLLDTWRAMETLVDDLHRDVSFSGQLGAYSVWCSVANIRSRLSVLLPEGLLYTSDSGFLSDVPAAVTVPEPSMATLLLIAAVAFTLVVRGKGKRRALL